MDIGKHNRSLTLLCPQCKGAQFSGIEAGSSGSHIVTCASCGHELTREALIQANRPAIQSEMEKMKANVIKDVRAEIAKAFGGNKTIKIKL